MQVCTLYAHITDESEQALLQHLETSPFKFSLGPVPVLTSSSDLEEFLAPASDYVATAETSQIMSAYDDQTRSTDLVMILRSPDLESMHQQMVDTGAVSVLPYPYLSYMRMTYGGFPRRRRFVTFANSISNAFTSRPIRLLFGSYTIEWAEMDTAPFATFFQNMTITI